MSENIIKEKMSKISSYARHMSLFSAYRKQVRTDLGKFRFESFEAMRRLSVISEQN